MVQKCTFGYGRGGQWQLGISLHFIGYLSNFIRYFFIFYKAPHNPYASFKCFFIAKVASIDA